MASPGSLAAYLVVIVPAVVIGAIVFPSRWSGVIVIVGIAVHYVRLCLRAGRVSVANPRPSRRSG